MPTSAACRWLLTALLGGAPAAAGAFGAEGHRVAGLLAAPLLCERGASEIGVLAGGRSLQDFGHWADTVREDPAWQRSAPWHYVNVPDGAAVRELAHPEEGDVLWAIDNFARVLGDRSQPDAARAVALQFLTHFIVDVHQPLHVGRAEDRGGNEVRVRHGRTETDLHSFWDSGAIAQRAQAPDRYARELQSVLDALRRSAADIDPAAWAEESLALHAQVYAFDAATGELDRDYLGAAERILNQRLAQAALRLASMLNFVLCGEGPLPDRPPDVSTPQAEPDDPARGPRRIFGRGGR